MWLIVLICFCISWKFGIMCCMMRLIVIMSIGMVMIMSYDRLMFLCRVIMMLLMYMIGVVIIIVLVISMSICICWMLLVL